MMNSLRTIGRILGYGSAAAVAVTMPYITYSVLTWARYGHVHVNRFTRDNLLDQFLPLPEVDECHRIRVGAPTAVTFAAARELDIQRSPIVRGIFMLRTLPELLRGESTRSPSRALLAETLSIGWGILSDLPDREIVVGAITQPWEPVVTFHPLPPEEFAAFNKPGYAKIVWTLSAEPVGLHGSMFTTRTRVSTTDPLSRERFRRYWALFSPGILIIRYTALWLVKAEAERRSRRLVS